MLTKFRILYPQGSIVGELVTINHGQYIVRVLIKAGSVTLGTGLAGANTIEEAEDIARNRALKLLKLDSVSLEPNNLNTFQTQDNHNSSTISMKIKAHSPSSYSKVPTTEVIDTIDSEKLLAESLTEETKSKSSSHSLSISDINKIVNEPIEEIFPKPWLTKAESTSFDDKLSEPMEKESLSSSQVQETFISTSEIGKMSTSTTTISQVASEVSSSEKESSLTTIEEPLEFSEIIGRSNIEMKRLGWTKMQGREYLIQTYGKRSRQVLSDEELLEFLDYLESLPTPYET
ncbi:hypothetical protein [Cyanobacterium sp. uoEpiScrs1]|uniref:hypothetical protein n=1 Tax=Cyanobacterium sp. uoEpiScrs1 TaxID=2976343 RepID=UPI00226A4BCB|nr:hypothetical protein [Cyanobacterium sp. uoEpiScrs1]